MLKSIVEQNREGYVLYNLFYYNTENLTDEIYNKEFSMLSKSQQKKLNNKKNFSDRKQSLAGIMLVKKYLSKLYNIPEQELLFANGEHGKPYVLNLPAHFNISHSKNYAVVAISDEPIGIDTEALGDFSAITAKKLFSKSELKYISGEKSTNKKPDMQRCFYELWTAKEAYLKYTGKGLSGGINSLEFEYVNGKIIPNKSEINLVFDYSIPNCITAVVTAAK